MWHLLGDVLNFSTLVASFFVCVVRRKVNPVGGGCLGWGFAGSFGRKRHRLHSGLFAISSRETGVMSGGCVIRRVAGFSSFDAGELTGRRGSPRWIGTRVHRFRGPGGRSGAGG